MNQSGRTLHGDLQIGGFQDLGDAEGPALRTDEQAVGRLVVGTFGFPVPFQAFAGLHAEMAQRADRG